MESGKPNPTPAPTGTVEIQTQTPAQAGAQTQVQQTLPIEEIRRKFQTLERTLNKLVIGHDDAVKGLLLGLISGEHVALIGPPGTAKTMLVRTLAQLIGAKSYTYLMTKFTSYDELFGPVDITALTRGEFKRRWSNIVSADIIFLDEIFKANSAILNSLLSLMQERIVYDPISGVAMPASLHMLVGASNEIPSDGELQALYDRFAVRVFIDYLGDNDSLAKAVQARWTNGVSLTPVMTMQEVRYVSSLIKQLMTVKVEGFGDTLIRIFASEAVPLVQKLREKGVIVSDRTAIEKLPKLYVAYLILYGVTQENIVNAVHEVILYTARDRSELAGIKKVLDEALGELAEMANKLEEAKRLAKAGDLKTAKERLLEILNTDPSKFEKAPWMKQKFEALVAAAREYLSQIEYTLKRFSMEL